MPTSVVEEPVSTRANAVTADNAANSGDGSDGSHPLGVSYLTPDEAIAGAAALRALGCDATALCGAFTSQLLGVGRECAPGPLQCWRGMLRGVAWSGELGANVALSARAARALGRLSQLERINLGGGAAGSGAALPALGAALGGLAHLTELNLGENALHGALADAALHRLTRLRVLRVHQNALTGALPTQLALLSELTEVGDSTLFLS